MIANLEEAAVAWLRVCSGKSEEWLRRATKIKVRFNTPEGKQIPYEFPDFQHLQDYCVNMWDVMMNYSLKHTLKAGMFQVEKGVESLCAFCLGGVPLGTEVGVLICGHWFHENCMKEVVHSSFPDVKCPYCRRIITVDLGNLEVFYFKGCQPLRKPHRALARIIIGRQAGEPMSKTHSTPFQPG